MQRVQAFQAARLVDNLQGVPDRVRGGQAEIRDGLGIHGVRRAANGGTLAGMPFALAGTLATLKF